MLHGPELIPRGAWKQREDNHAKTRLHSPAPALENNTRQINESAIGFGRLASDFRPENKVNPRFFDARWTAADASSVLFQQIAWGTGEMAVDFQDLHARVDVLHADQGDAAFVRAYGFKLHTVGHQRQRLMLDFSAIQLLYPILSVFGFRHVHNTFEQDFPLTRLGSPNKHKDRLVAAPALFFPGKDLVQVGGRDGLHRIQRVHNYRHI